VTSGVLSVRSVSGRLSAENQLECPGDLGLWILAGFLLEAFCKEVGCSMAKLLLRRLSAWSGVVELLRLGAGWPASGQSKAPNRSSNMDRGLL